MTVCRYGLSKYGLTVDAVNDSVRPSFRNLGAVMKVRLTVGPKIAKRPNNGILTIFSSILDVACVLITQTNDWCNNERKRKGKRIAKGLCLDQDSNPGLNSSQQESI